MGRELKILMIEDMASHAEHVSGLLKKEGVVFTAQRVETREEIIRSIREFHPDLILSDYSLPTLNGDDTLKLAAELCPDIPFIFVTGAIGEEKAVELLRAGATDYVPKSPNMMRLVPAIKQAIRNFEERRNQEIKDLALRESEERYRKLVESVTDYIYTVIVRDGQAVSTKHAPGCLAVTGYSNDELDADPFLWLRMVHEEDRALVLRQSEEILSAGTAVPVEHRIVRKDGSVRWIRNSAVPHYDTEGKLISYDGLIVDISERKIVEEALRKAKDELRSIYDSITDILSVQDTEYRIISYNRTAENIWGKDLKGRLCYEVYQGREEICPDCPVRKAISTGKPAFSFQPETKTSPPVETSAFPIFSENGKVAAVVEYAKDVSEKLKMEALIKSILENVGEGFLLIDRDFRIISANKAYCDQVGKAADEVIGKHCYEISHRNSQPCHETTEKCGAIQTFKTGMPSVNVHIHNDQSNRKRSVEIRTFPMKDAAGNVIGIIETLNDITERSRLQEQLLQSQKMEAVGHLAGGVAHDFNNILTAIMGYANLLKLKIGSDNPLISYTEHILSSSERAAYLTQSLLAFSRKQIINPLPIDLNQIVIGVEKLLRRLIGEDIDLSVECYKKALVVMADRGQIDQVIMNLATNARDAMPSGGTISISTGEMVIDEEFAALHGLEKPGRYAKLTFGDSGAGMDRETMTRIFEPFFTTKETGKGTGLGLSIVYGILKQQGGHIEAESEKGKGTVFTFYLPLLSTEFKEDEKKKEEEVKGGTETVLLAEDDNYVRSLLKIILKEAGYTVIEATNGEEAVAEFLKHKGTIKLLLSDVVMPQMNGSEASKLILKYDSTVKILLMSGYTDDIIHKKNILDSGVNFIEKPIVPRNLLRKIREVLGT